MFSQKIISVEEFAKKAKKKITVRIETIGPSQISPSTLYKLKVELRASFRLKGTAWSKSTFVSPDPEINKRNTAELEQKGLEIARQLNKLGFTVTICGGNKQWSVDEFAEYLTNKYPASKS